MKWEILTFHSTQSVITQLKYYKQKVINDPCFKIPDSVSRLRQAQFKVSEFASVHWNDPYRHLCRINIVAWKRVDETRKCYIFTFAHKHSMQAKLRRYPLVYRPKYGCNLPVRPEKNNTLRLYHNQAEKLELTWHWNHGLCNKLVKLQKMFKSLTNLHKMKFDSDGKGSKNGNLESSSNRWSRSLIILFRTS